MGCSPVFGSVPGGPGDSPAAVGGVSDRESGLRGRGRWLARWLFPRSRYAGCPRRKLWGCRCPSLPTPACPAPPSPLAPRGAVRYCRWRQRGVGDLHWHEMRGDRGLPSGLSSTIAVVGVAPPITRQRGRAELCIRGMKPGNVVGTALRAMLAKPSVHAAAPPTGAAALLLFFPLNYYLLDNIVVHLCHEKNENMITCIYCRLALLSDD